MTPDQEVVLVKSYFEKFVVWQAEIVSTISMAASCREYTGLSQSEYFQFGKAATKL